MASRFNERSFIEQVADSRGYDLKKGRGNDDWRLSATDGPIEWQFALAPMAEGSTTLRWRAPNVRFDPQRSDVNVRIIRAGTRSARGVSSTDSLVADIVVAAAAGLLSALRRKRSAPTPRRAEPGDVEATTAPASPLGPGWWVEDPAGVLDADLITRFGSPPVAFHGGRPPERAVELQTAHLRADGLVVHSERWWDSSEAVVYQIDLGVALARRIIAVRGY